jgi:hypothetical protein
MEFTCGNTHLPLAMGLCCESVTHGPIPATPGPSVNFSSVSLTGWPHAQSSWKFALSLPFPSLPSFPQNSHTLSPHYISKRANVCLVPPTTHYIHCLLIPILQMRQLRLKKLKWLNQGLVSRVRYFLYFTFFFFLAALGLELRAFTLSHSTSPLL